MAESDCIPVYPGGRRRLPRPLGLIIVGAVVVAAALSAPVRPGVVCGRSMEPGFSPGQLFLWAPLSQPEGVLRRGDVILLRLKGALSIKRIYALGGDEYWTIGSPHPNVPYRFLIAVGEAIPRWRRRFWKLRFFRHRVPPGHVFVVGDAQMSFDSRITGPVRTSEVVGRVMVPPGSRVVCTTVLTFPDRRGGPPAWAPRPARPAPPGTRVATAIPFYVGNRQMLLRRTPGHRPGL